jgi:hypothetical protein
MAGSEVLALLPPLVPFVCRDIKSLTSCYCCAHSEDFKQFVVAALLTQIEISRRLDEAFRQLGVIFQFSLCNTFW